MILYIKDFSKYVTDEEQHEIIKKLINEIEQDTPILSAHGWLDHRRQSGHHRHRVHQ